MGCPYCGYPIGNQCKAADVPFFFKKDSDSRHTLDGKTWEEFPNA